LFKREEISTELVKAISSYTLDCYDEYGNLGQKGTSREAVQYLSRWITNFNESKDFGVKCKYLDGNDVTLESIKECILNKGCVNLRTYQSCEHYVTITNIDNIFVYIFDPYYFPESHYKNNDHISCITDEPFSYNRKVSIKRFLSDNEYEFALGPISKRECVLFIKK